jgi:hypothetical protein
MDLMVNPGTNNLLGMFQEYNATIEFYWAPPFLVESNSDDPDIHSISDRMIKPTSIAKHIAIEHKKLKSCHELL